MPKGGELQQNNKTMIAQFRGETRKESIINHFSLDIEEEEGFFQYLEEMGYDENSDDEILESLIIMYRDEKTK